MGLKVKEKGLEMKGREGEWERRVKGWVESEGDVFRKEGEVEDVKWRERGK